MSMTDRSPMSLPPCPGHEWVVPVHRDAMGIWILSKPADATITDAMRLVHRGILYQAAVHCHICGETPGG